MRLNSGARHAGLILASLVLFGCASDGPAYGPASSDAAVSVEMTNGFSFSPQDIRIKTGDVVEWRNKSLFTHTVTDDPQKDPKSAALPAGASPFDSGRIAAGQVFRQSFTVPGTYRYFCVPHDDLGMAGTIVVEPRS